MAWLSDLIGKSPFGAVAEHTRNVHACVEFLKEAADALVNDDRERIMHIHHEIARMEHEADKVKNEIRKQIYGRLFMSVDKDALARFLSAQDDVADRAMDFVVVLTLRPTKLDPELKDEFVNLVQAVVETSESLLVAALELKVLAERSFSGPQAEEILETISGVGEKEWTCDKLQRRFARHFYSLEDRLDPITLFMYDKWTRKLGQVADAAEKAGKYLRTMIEKG